MPVTSTPSSTSQAAVRNVDGAVLSWWKWPVSNEMPAYRAAAACGDGVQPERAGDVADELARAARGAAHERELAVPRVVVMVVDVDGDVSPARQRQAVAGCPSRARRARRPPAARRGARARRAAGRRREAAARPPRRTGPPGRRAARRGRACRPPRRARRYPASRGRRARRAARRACAGTARRGRRRAASRLVLAAVRSPRSAPPSASSAPASGSSPGTRISCGSSPSTSASRLSARSMRRALSSVSS